MQFSLMKYLNKTRLSLLVLILMGYLSLQNTSGSHTTNGGRTGAPFDNGTCATGTGCHTSGSFTPTATIQVLDGTTPVSSYTSSKSYTVRITIAASGTSSNNKYGFQGVCVQSSTNNNINNWGTMPTQTKKVTISGRTYVSHSYKLNSGVIDIPWTSPATTTGNITFYAAGIVTNNNNQNTGDDVASTSLTITPAAAGCTTPVVNTSVTHVTCSGDKNGSISVVTTGGSSPFNFDWSGPGFSSNSKNITGLSGGNYTLIVTANGGCKDTFYATVNEPPKFESNATPDTIVCAGTNLTLSSSATGGNGGYNYVWSGPGSIGSGSATLNLTNLSAANDGDYILTIRDAKNCTLRDTVAVKVDSMPQAEGIIATKQSNNTYQFSIDNGRYMTGILWQYGDGQTDTKTVPTHTFTTNGTFITKVILTNHCGSDTFDVTLNIWPEGINESAKAMNGIKVFPNPASNYIELKTTENNELRMIKMQTLQGTVVYSSATVQNGVTRIDVSKYPAGIYILQVETDMGRQSLPVSVRH